MAMTVLSKELQCEETTGHPLNSRKNITTTVWFHQTLYWQTGCHIQTRGSSWHINLSINLHQPTKWYDPGQNGPETENNISM